MKSKSRHGFTAGALLAISLGLPAAACKSEAPAPPATTAGAPEKAPESQPESAPGAHDHHDHAAQGGDAHAGHKHEVLPAADVPPGTSLYQLDVELTAQNGEPLTWADLKGQPVVVSMIYSSCTTACPLIVHEVKQILEGANVADSHRVVLFSMDPERDDPAALTAMHGRHKLGANWTLVRPAPDDVAEVAAALGVRYRQLPNKDFNHSQVIALLDKEGTVVARAEGLGPQRDQVISAITAK